MDPVKRARLRRQTLRMSQVAAVHGPEAAERLAFVGTRPPSEAEARGLLRELRLGVLRRDHRSFGGDSCGQRGRSARPAVNTRQRGSRRSTVRTGSTSRGDPDLDGEHHRLAAGVST
jgi:hypothetical protein